MAEGYWTWWSDEASLDVSGAGTPASNLLRLVLRIFKGPAKKDHVWLYSALTA